MKFKEQSKRPKDLLITIDDFRGGSNSLVDQAKMDSKFAYESKNMIQVQDGIWKTRWGTKDYGAEHAANPDGASEYVKSDGTTELITIADGKVWKSTDGGTLTEVTGATFTAGTPCYFMQMGGYNTSGEYQNYLYIANGTDSLARYNGTDLETYTSLSAPANLSGALASGLSSGVHTMYAQVTALNEVGETVGSTEASITTNKARSEWDSTANEGITWSWDAVAGASRYQLYVSDVTGNEEWLTATEPGVTSFTDDGTLDINPYVITPDANTTAAPKFKSMAVSNNRIWATNDPNNKYRVYFSGTGINIGKFSEFYGGGYINLERGGKELPIAVKHYQSGTGEGRATVLCKTPNGQGAVWQISIIGATVGDTSFSVPSAAKVVGSFGTESINGVVQATNNIAFPNRRGWFTLGAQVNYFGILRTKELSSNIRPYWRDLEGSKIEDICAYFYDSKIFISVPTSTAGNDRIVIFDEERSNWTVDWTVGAKQFLEYTDTAGKTHFLYIPLTGTKLIELSENFLNDNGTRFNQSYVSPLLPVSKDVTDIMSLKEAIVELGLPQGVIKFQILGIGKNNAFSTLATSTITSFAANTGVGSDLAGDFFATSTNDNSSGGEDSWAVYFTDSPSTFTQNNTRKAIRKRAKIYAVQFKVYSTNSDTNFAINKLQARGTLIKSRMPSSWVS